MNTLWKSILLCLPLLLSNCATNQIPKSLLNTLPLQQQISLAKHNAKKILTKQKLLLPKESPYFILTEESECTVNGQHCIISAKHNMKPVLGYIEFINVPPQTAFITVVSHNNNINYNTLVHEFAHYYLILNYNDYSHNPNFKDLFSNWQD